MAFPSVFRAREPVEDKTIDPVAEGMMLAGEEGTKRIGEKEIAEAYATLQKYKACKANLETRVVEDEMWWELRHWEAVGRSGPDKRAVKCDCMGRPLRGPEPTSAWLFNSIANKHADAMDNYPEPVVLPRERSDEESARVLSEVLPVILEYNDFQQTYSDNWWEKLKHGTAVYGIFWDSSKENGLGDIAIRGIDLLNIFWEPGVQDIQKSRNLFTVELVDNDQLEARYPELRGKLGKGDGGIDVTKYIYDDNVNTENKSCVIDWYYKTAAPGGRTVLHYAKFVSKTLLYASENEPGLQDRGFYDHGLYPFVFDSLFPERGTPVGFGYVAVCKDPQLYIDKLSGNILEYSMRATKPRWFVSSNTGVNEMEYMDWDRPLVHVEGQLDDTRLRQITLDPMSGIYTNVLQMKIEELKETSANRDVNSGGSTGGVTAASAIAALQEAGNKISRDMIAAAYRADSEIAELVIELIRQFYDEARTFRITGQVPGQYEFVDVSNAAMKPQPMGADAMGVELVRKPVFDLKISAQKRNPFSRMEQNERAKELYGLGFFNPERAQEALGALEMMDFEGIDKVREDVQQGQTLLNICQQLQSQVQQLMVMAGLSVQAPVAGGAQPPQEAAQADGGSSIDAEAARAQTPMTSYGQRLAKRSAPDMNAGAPKPLA